MKMRGILAVATLAVGSVTMAAQADLLAYWNFNTFDPGTDTVINADAGSGTVDLSGWGGGVQNFAGTTENALFGDESGASLSLQGGDNLGGGVFAGNGTWIDVNISMSNYQDLIVSFATRGTGTGFDTGTWSWSTDGTSFTTVPGVNTASQSSSWSVPVVDFSSFAALNDAANVTLRYTLDGASSSSGNNRIDNLQVNATLIPAPGALALLGVAGLIGVRRRRA